MTIRKKLAAAAFAAFAIATAHAEVRTYEFTGTVVYSTYMQGHRIRGTFSYDDAAAGSHPLSWMGFYLFELPFHMEMKVGPHRLTSDGLHVTVSNDTGTNIEDSLSISGSSLVLDGTTYSSGYFGMSLGTGYGPSQALTSTALPGTIRLEDFATRYGYVMRDGSATGMLMQFTVDSLQPVTRP